MRKHDGKGAYRLGTDIGGTFTDVVLARNGVKASRKVLTTSAPVAGLMCGVGSVLEQTGVLPSEIDLVLHGTTLATNALIERRGARTALFVTEGHRDSLEIGYENRFAQYDIMADRSPPLVPRSLRLPVPERVDFRGRVLRALDEEAVFKLLAELDAKGVRSIAVGLLHSYVNPAHERRIASMVRTHVPWMSLSLSSDVCPEVREYDRQTTTVANAYIKPAMERYLSELESRLTAFGICCPCLMMTSAGSLVTIATARACPVRLIESGPAGGAVLSSVLARRLQEDRVVSFDMGGTTAKICLIDKGEPLLSRRMEVDRAYRFMKGSGIPLNIPVVEMMEIGAGGGSLAHVDSLGRLRVGPRSAGCDPGPACYGRQGTHPTVTDANLVLGRLNSALFASGAFRLHADAAAAALTDHVGGKRKENAEEAALGVIAVVDENMATAARVHAVEQGKEIGGRTMIAFGGAAPLHAAHVAEKLGIDEILVPRHAGVGSAVGFLLSPVAYEVVRSRYVRLSALDAATISALRILFAEMRTESRKVVGLGAPGAPLMESRRVYARYIGQGHEIGVELPPDFPAAESHANMTAALTVAFERAYSSLFGRTLPGLDIEMLTWSMRVRAQSLEKTQEYMHASHSRGTNGSWCEVSGRERADEPKPADVQTSVRNPGCIGTRKMVFPNRRDSCKTTLYSWDRLHADSCLTGAAVVFSSQTTVVVPPDWQARVVTNGDLLVFRARSLSTDAQNTQERNNPQRRRPAANTQAYSNNGAHSAEESRIRSNARVMQSSDSRSADALQASCRAFSSELRFQILWDRLLSLVEEQAQVIVRTAFSTTVREAGDLSAGVFDLQGRMLAQAVTGTPGHVNAMASSVGFFLRKYPLGEMVEGDVYITNDPWLGTGHLFDFTVVTPCFRNGAAVGLFASTVHVVDIGGLGFGPDAGQVFEEGLCIPITRLFSGGRANASVFDIIRANVREPVQVVGDLYALTSSNDTGCRRLRALMGEFDIDGLGALADYIIDASYRGMLTRIRRLPSGSWSHEMTVDGYHEPIRLVARTTISEDGISVDFDGTSQMSSYGINVPLTYTQAYASFGIRSVVGHRIPNNTGSLKPIRIFAPEGSILNAPRPAAVAVRHVIGQMLPDVVFGCLEQAVPGSVPAEGSSSLWNPMLSGGHGITGAQDYGSATPFSVTIFHSGGTGARPGKDGLSATAFPSGVRSTPVEITETISPLVFVRKELRPGSGGAGVYRGGDGQIIEIEHRQGAPFAVFALFDRIHHPARGRSGGASGAPGLVRLASGSVLRGKGKQIVPAGDRLILALPGGGGLGKPPRDANGHKTQGN